MAPRETEAVDEAELEEVRAIFVAVEKTLRVFRLYPENNRIFVDFTEDLAGRFHRFLVEHHELRVGIEESRFLYGGHVVHEDANKARSLPLHLYRDNVRRIVFYEGFGKDELLDLLDVLTRRPDPDDLEDDLVTLLWEKDFAHLSYFVLDDISEGDDPDLQREIKEATDDPDDADITGLKSAKKDKYLAPSLSARSLSAILSIGPSELRAVEAMIAHENGRNLRHDLTTLLFEMVHLLDSPEAFENAVSVLGQLVQSYLQTLNVKEAAEILRKFRDLAASDLPQEKLAVVNGQIAKVTDPEVLRAVARVFDQPIAKSAGDVTTFFRLVGPAAVPVLFEMLPRARSTQLLVAIVTELGREAPSRLIERLSDRNPVVLRNVISVLASLGHPAYASYLEPHLSHPDVAVRLETVRAMAGLGGDTGEAGLKKALSDPEYQVRIHALRCIEELSLLSLLPLLEEMVEEKDFQARNLYEKQEVFRTIARLGGEDTIPFLDRMVERRGLFRKSASEEIRIAAASALGWLPGNAVISRLLKLSKHGSKGVREAADIAIRRIRGQEAGARGGD